MKFALFLLVLSAISCAKAPSDSSSVGEVIQKIDFSVLETCSVDTPCSRQEDSCSYYGEGDAVCYERGREGEIAGCTYGELIFMNSYPGQAGCR